MHSVRRVGMALDWLHWWQCFALHYWNAVWIWGCPSAVVTAPALQHELAHSFFFSLSSFSSCDVWSRGNTIFFSAWKVLVLVFFFPSFLKPFSGAYKLKCNKGEKKPRGRDLKFDLQTYLVDVVEITELFCGGNKVQCVVFSCGQVCQM